MSDKRAIIVTRSEGSAHDDGMSRRHAWDATPKIILRHIHTLADDQKVGTPEWHKARIAVQNWLTEADA